MREAFEQVQEKFEQHPLTRRLPASVLKDWCEWATEQAKAFQRASSAAVEGRNGELPQMHHNHRGLPKRRYQAWWALHNFDCRDANGQTPAARFRAGVSRFLRSRTIRDRRIAPPSAMKTGSVLKPDQTRYCPGLNGHPDIRIDYRACIRDMKRN